MIVGPRYNDVDPAVEAAYERAAEADHMTRDDLRTWLTRFGWTKTGELPGVCENWEPPTDVRDTWVTVPLRQDASDYEHYMRRAWNTLGRHEGPRLLAVVREVAAANDRYMRGEITGVALSIDLHAAVTALTEEETDV